MSAVNANTVMNDCDVNQMLLNTLKTSYKDMLQDVIRVISNHYNLDNDEVLKYVNGKIDGVNLVKKEKVTKPKAPKFDFPIPFCGEVNENLCKGIKFNRGLFTQCPKKPGTGTHYCATCKKSADSMENKKPAYGDIRDRVHSDFKDYKGRTPKTWATVLKSMGKNMEDCKKKLESELGIEIPEEELVVIETTKGRPAKSEKKKSKKNVDDDMANALDESSNEPELEKVQTKKKLDKSSMKKINHPDGTFYVDVYEDNMDGEGDVYDMEGDEPKLVGVWELAGVNKYALQFHQKESKKTKKVKKMKLKKSKMTKVNYKEQPFYVANDGSVYDMDGEKPVHVGSYDENEERIIGNSKYASYFIYDEPDESESEDEDEDDELFSDEEED